MLKVVYYIDPEDKESEIQWLKNQRVYPSMHNFHSWRHNKEMTMIGIIASEEVITLLKLRRELFSQTNYSLKK